MILTSRLQKRPVSAVAKCASSTGKSFVIERVLEFFPETAYYKLTSASEKTLVFTDEPIQHRMLIWYELAGIRTPFLSYIIRSLLSEGQLSYETVVKLDGEYTTQKVEKRGPTGFLTTTTESRVDPSDQSGQLETRLLSIPLDDSPEQTRRTYQAYLNKKRMNTREWVCFQEWLQESGKKVVLPFRHGLAQLFSARDVRLRRDFPAVISLIKTHALIHQLNRKTNKKGRIVATKEDYQAVYNLVAELVAEAVKAGVSEILQDTVKAVERLHKKGKGVTYTSLAKALAIDTSAAFHRVQKAIEKDYLRNRQTWPRQPADIVLGEALPQGSVLPTPEALFQFESNKRAANKTSNRQVTRNQQVNSSDCTFDQKHKKKEKRQGKTQKRANAQTPHSKSRSSGDSSFEGTTQTRGYGKLDVARAAKELRKRGWEV